MHCFFSRDFLYLSRLDFFFSFPVHHRSNLTNKTYLGLMDGSFFALLASLLCCAIRIHRFGFLIYLGKTCVFVSLSLCVCVYVCLFIVFWGGFLFITSARHENQQASQAVMEQALQAGKLAKANTTSSLITHQ